MTRPTLPLISGDTQAKSTILGDGFLDNALDKAGYLVLANGYRVKWEQPISFNQLDFPDEYPVEVLPPIIRAAVEEVQADTQAPAALVAASALSVVSTVVQGYVSVERKEGLVGPVSLYLLTIAKSGERKTACDNKFTPILHEYEKSWREYMKPALAAHEALEEAWETIEAGYKDQLRKFTRDGLDTTGIVNQLTNHALRRPVKPRVPQMLRGDDTPEALAVALEAWPIASIISAEAGVLFGAVGMNADNVMRNFGQANVFWDGGSFKRTRTTQQSVDIEGMRVTMGLQVQPAVIENFASKLGKLAQGIGYFARFLLSQPQSTQGTRFFKETQPGQPALDAFTTRARAILSIPVSMDPTGKLNTATLQFTPEAKQSWVEFYNDVESRLGDGREFYKVQEVASKIAEQAARIAACFHVFDAAPSWLISDAHMRAAIRLAWWYLDESLRYCKMNTVPEVVRHADAVEEWLARQLLDKKLDCMSVSQIQKAGPGSVRKKQDLDPVLQLLEVHHRIRVIGPNEKKREVYMNPLVLKDYE